MQILIVEDNHDLREALEESFKEEGFEAFGVEKITGNEFLASNKKPDLVILDQNLPGAQGTDILKKIRSIENLEKIHVIMISGDSDRDLINNAYDVGADDFVSKPFDVDLLIKKVSAIKRRLRPTAITKCGITLDAKSLSASFGNQKIDLSKTEFFLFYEMAKDFPESVSREDLIQRGLRGAHVTTRTIDVHICALRKKLNTYGLAIDTIRNIGYCLRIIGSKSA